MKRKEIRGIVERERERGGEKGESKSTEREEEKERRKTMHRKRNCRLRLERSMVSMSITSMWPNPESACKQGRGEGGRLVKEKEGN